MHVTENTIWIAGRTLQGGQAQAGTRAVVIRPHKPLPRYFFGDPQIESGHGNQKTRTWRYKRFSWSWHELGP